jgi:hypothetical protein
MIQRVEAPGFQACKSLASGADLYKDTNPTGAMPDLYFWTHYP